MRINIIGAGPAGLYAAILLRRMRPDLQVQVFEQNAADATFGFGVVFSDQALDLYEQVRRDQSKALADGAKSAVPLYG